MELLLDILPWIQVVLAVIVTGAVLLQERGAGLGGAFGASEGTIHYERRGFERTLFKATAVIAIVFVLSVFVETILSQYVAVSAPSVAVEPFPVDATGTDAIIELNGDDMTVSTGTPVVPQTEVDASLLEQVLESLDATTSATEAE